MENKMWAYLIHLAENMWHDGDHHISPWQPTLQCDDAIWREVVDFLPGCGINTLVIDVGDGMAYESHPEITIPGAWSKDKLKKELDRIRSLGITPIPKLNFSACHDVWLKEYSRMLSTSIYYRVCADVIREVWEVFDKPAYFHLGFDEETARHQAGYQYAVMRQGELWWHDANYFFDTCENLGTRPWIWADYAWDHPQEFKEKMSKSVLLSNWYYGTFDRNPDGTLKNVAAQMYVDLDRAGFDQVPTSSTWSNWWNTQQTMALCRNEVSEERLLGYMTAPWLFTVPEMKYGLLHDAHTFAVARKKIYGDK